METCESEKAKLLVITTKDQIADIKPYLPYGMTYAGIWDRGNEGTWIGWDGKEVLPTWKPGEPNGNTYQNCGCFVSNEIGLQDETCLYNHYFVCYKT
ncbi:hypothetical protein ACJMK2_001688 [Sinanodonta woodiana]|uniref:C-type lectin domain-containing protein n=1 Tax=Sinanodonta woodiana TaxID=1069815 RepID=A0ABD3XSZ1_SINWO